MPLHCKPAERLNRRKTIEENLDSLSQAKFGRRLQATVRYVIGPLIVTIVIIGLAHKIN